MLKHLFPKQFDNIYRGHWLAIWLLVPIVILYLIMGGNSMWHPHYVATSADGIPLDSYTAGGAQAVVSMYAQMGLCLLLLTLQGVLVLIRYRAMIPYVYLLLLAQELGGTLLNHLYPIAKSGVSTEKAGLAVVLAILAMTLAGFILSLVPKRRPPERPAAAGTH